jgi:hypothetical protein
MMSSSAGDVGGRVMRGVRQLSHSEGSMLTYTEAKQFLIENLSRDAAAHEAGRYRDIGRAFDELDANLPRSGGREFDQLFITLAFWDGWIDARNHDWQYYDEIGEADWPALARKIVASLASGQEITEPAVLRHFDFRARQPRAGRLKSLLARLQGK